MRNILRLLPVLILLSLQSKAQCDAGFRDTIYGNSNQVNFISLTPVQHIKHTWLFGDGTSGSAANPVHTYNQPGQFNVLHIVTDSLHTCIDSVMKTVTVNFTPQPCNAGFTDSVYQNQVRFVSVATAQNIKHTWLFGDGTSGSAANPVHTYTQPGQYNVLHMVMDSLHTCVDSVRNIITVGFTPVPTQCDARFTDSVYQNQVRFVSVATAQNIKHTWLFGDGSSGSAANPVHTYTQPGQYNVLHMVMDSLHTCVDSVRKIITVNPTAGCQVRFVTYQVPLSNKYYFYPQYTIPGSALKSIDWSINGIHVSSQESFSYKFDQAGRYNVCVSIQSTSGCIARYCDTIAHIPYANCKVGVSFTAIPAAPQSRTIQFTASPDQPQLKYSWKFGDAATGSPSEGRRLSHTYYLPGKYRVSLTVIDSSSHCIDTVSRIVEVIGTPAESCTVSFTHTAIGNSQVSFVAISNQKIVSQVWSIYHLPDSFHAVTIQTPDPVYTFKDSGYYVVCLSIVTNTGCNWTICDSLVAGPSGSVKRNASVPSYPNPVSASETVVKLNINMEENGLVHYKVCDLSGNVVYQAQMAGIKGTNNIAVPIQRLGKGQYFIDISFGNQQRRSRFYKL
jgi:PKD repeat protein